MASGWPGMALQSYHERKSASYSVYQPVGRETSCESHVLLRYTTLLILTVVFFFCKCNHVY
jgi:hypothetical protein